MGSMEYLTFQEFNFIFNIIQNIISWKMTTCPNGDIYYELLNRKFTIIKWFIVYYVEKSLVPYMGGDTASIMARK